MYSTQNGHRRSSKGILSNSFSSFLRLLYSKTTSIKLQRRRFLVNSFRYTKHHHVEFGQNMERINESRSPNVKEVPLTEEDDKSWLEFKKINKKKPVIGILNDEIADKAKIPIKVDHPFVLVVGDFAVAAFNDLCEMHVKKGERNNLRHHEVKECKYLKHTRHYCFHMTMEAIEEGILGVYETLVACDHTNGSKTLIKFFLVDRKPSGKIAMTLPHLICMKFKYRAMKGMKKDIETKLEIKHTFIKGMNKRKVGAELTRLKEQHKALKGVCNVLYHNIWLQIPTNWNERSNPDGWSIPNTYTSGLKMRCKDAICKGYNYRTQSSVYSDYTGW